jgi:hypothetical protein
MDRTIRRPNDQRAQRRQGTRGAIRLVRLLPAILSPPLESWRSKVCKFTGRRRAWQCSTFGVPLSPGRATTDLKPRSTTCCPNSGSTSPSSTIARRKESSLTRKQPNQRSAPDPRSVRSQVVTPTPKTTSLFGTPCLRLHNATHITQHSKKKSKKGRIRNKPDINQL